MTTATFDARDHIRFLMDTGDFTEKQAEAIVNADERRREAERQGDDGVVTKRYMELVLDAKFSKHETKQLRWGIAVVTTHTVIILGVVYALFQALFQALSLK